MSPEQKTMRQGVLYIIATPIGNLEDITLRALRILNEVDLIAAEDTRKAGILLNHYNIQKPLISYFDHNEKVRAVSLVRRLLEGKSIALISEAGTPIISDPGYRLITEAYAHGIKISPIPGPCAAIAALAVAGLPTHRFAFEGFLPPKSGKRKRMLASLATEERTLVFYESPHRIQHSIADMIEILGNRKAVVARELTKHYEEIVRGTLSEIAKQLEGVSVRGEITLVVEGYTPARMRANNSLTKQNE